MFNTPDDFTTAIHESGHSVAASHYKIPSYPEVTPHGYSVVTQTVSAEHAGLCHYDNGPMTRFQHAVISWAGPLAHCLYGTRHDWMPPFKPTAKLLRDWRNMMTQQIHRLSDGDKAGILAYHDSWRSCKSAFAIVRKNRARIIRLARAMTGATAEKKSVPMPETFPATFADFLRLIVCGNDAEEKFRVFVRVGLEKYFESLHLEPEQRQLGVESWMTLRLEKFRQGIPNAASWRATALAFAVWNKLNP